MRLVNYVAESIADETRQEQFFVAMNAGTSMVKNTILYFHPSTEKQFERWRSIKSKHNLRYIDFIYESHD